MRKGLDNHSVHHRFWRRLVLTNGIHLLSIALFFWPPFANAFQSSPVNTASISGTLINARGPFILGLRLDPFSPPLRIEARGHVQETLSTLASGSYVVGRGEIAPDQKSVRIDAVQTIGLREVLGVWKSSQNEVFEFRSFNRLFRYRSVQRDGATHLQLQQKFEYALTPDAGQAYSIFITDNQKRIFFGTLRVDGTIEADSAPQSPSSPSRILLLTMYDSQTGTESQKFSLSPLLVK